MLSCKVPALFNMFCLAARATSTSQAFSGVGHHNLPSPPALIIFNGRRYQPHRPAVLPSSARRHRRSRLRSMFRRLQHLRVQSAPRSVSSNPFHLPPPPAARTSKACAMQSFPMKMNPHTPRRHRQRLPSQSRSQRPSLTPKLLPSRPLSRR